MSILEDQGNPIVHITQGDREFFVMGNMAGVNGLNEKLKVITMMLFGLVFYLVVKQLFELFGIRPSVDLFGTKPSVELFGDSDVLKGEVGGVLLERPTDNGHGLASQPLLKEVDGVNGEAFHSGEPVKVEKVHVDLTPLVVPGLWYET